MFFTSWLKAITYCNFMIFPTTIGENINAQLIYYYEKIET